MLQIKKLNGNEIEKKYNFINYLRQGCQKRFFDTTRNIQY